MRISAATPLWLAAPPLLALRVDDFFAHWRQAQRTFAVDDIHDLRVSSRRLREGLLLFAPLYRPAALRRGIRPVRRVTRLLGAVRNADEALLFFRELAASADPVCRAPLAELLARYERHRRAEAHRLDDVLASLDAAATHAALAKSVARPRVFASPAAPVDPFMTVGAFAADGFARRLAELLELLPAASRDEDAAAQHRLRIAVKHYRYRLEILSFLLRDGYAALHDQLKGYQEVLGKMHDLDVFAGLVRQEGLPSAAECVILDRLAAQRQRHCAAFAALLAAHPFSAIGEQVRKAL